MVMKASLLISKDEALTSQKVKAFADAIAIGDALPTIIKVKVWTSNSNFVFKEKAARVTVWKKYPHLVGTDHGIMTWNELVLGYCHMAGMKKGAAAEGAAVFGGVQYKAA